MSKTVWYGETKTQSVIGPNLYTLESHVKEEHVPLDHITKDSYRQIPVLQAMIDHHIGARVQLDDSNRFCLHHSGVQYHLAVSH